MGFSTVAVVELLPVAGIVDLIQFIIEWNVSNILSINPSVVVADVLFGIVNRERFIFAVVA